MANYQLGPVIGKIGGVDVQKIPVEAVAGRNSTGDLMHTVHVPEGETWLVVLSGNLNPSNTNNNGPELSIGEVSIGPGLPSGSTALVAEVTGTAEVALKSNSSLGTDRFSGHVYVIPLPD